MPATAQQPPLFQVDPDDPNVDIFVDFMRSAHRWLRASDILSEWRMEDTDSNRRLIRALAEASGADIISGQKGYRHIEHASPEEVHHAAAWLESQAKKMSDRACAIRRRAHQIIG